MLINLDEQISVAIESEIAEAAGMTVQQFRDANVPGGMWPSNDAYEQAAAKADELRHQARV